MVVPLKVVEAIEVIEMQVERLAMQIAERYRQKTSPLLMHFKYQNKVWPNS